jgi:hypothetical protein
VPTDAAGYFGALQDRFATAREHRPAEDLWLRVAGRRVRLRFAGDRLRGVLAPVFVHLAALPTADAALTVMLWDAVSTGVAIPDVPWGQSDRDRIDRVRGFCDQRFVTVHEAAVDHLWMLDRDAGMASVYMADIDTLPVWERIHPLRRLLNSWARGFGADLVHAGAVGADGVGVLLVGPGGSGKSTTVLAAMAGGLVAAGDDYVLLETAGRRAHSLYGTMRLHEAHLDRFPELMRQRDQVFAEPWSGRTKVTSYVAAHFPRRMTDMLRLTAIAVPRVVPDLEAAPVRETAGRALMALAPSSMLQVDPMDTGALGRLAALVRTLPCWRLPLGPDPARVVSALRHILREPA